MIRTRVANITRNEPYDVYIGRSGKGQDGYFGNPIRVGHFCQRCRELHGTPLSTLPCFDSYFRARIATDAEFRTRVRELKGKVLGCFCAPGPCHGSLIAQWLNRSDEQIDANTNVLMACHSPAGRAALNKAIQHAAHTPAAQRVSGSICERLLHDLLIVNGKDACPDCGVTLISAAPGWAQRHQKEP